MTTKRVPTPATMFESDSTAFGYAAASAYITVNVCSEPRTIVARAAPPGLSAAVRPTQSPSASVGAASSIKNEAPVGADSSLPRASATTIDANSSARTPPRRVGGAHLNATSSCTLIGPGSVKFPGDSCHRRTATPTRRTAAASAVSPGCRVTTSVASWSLDSTASTAPAASSARVAAPGRAATSMEAPCTVVAWDGISALSSSK
ncbi:hypothetical protein M885DRAFT_549545 [Pelagophyceae sp. CCMP2097]|nr:hypothetical protein M885DRAFT_549545 [Pelagophyceae sp. CCMP2097]